MSKALPVPLDKLNFHPPVAGRLRFGKKTLSKKGKEIPTTIPTWRITSPHKELLDQLAEQYGGQVTPWEDGPRPGEFELFTESRELKVWLPPDPLGETPCYELWSGGGRLRFCNGNELDRDGGPGGGCFVPQQTGPDQAEEVEQDCVCRLEGKLSCKLTTRLRVGLADIDFAGVFQLSTGSGIAAEELPGMVQAVQFGMQQAGLPYAFLGIVERHTQGGRRQFKIPYLRLPTSMESLVSGSAQAILARGEGPPPAAALEAGEAEEIGDEWASPVDAQSQVVDVEAGPEPEDSEVVDAEVVVESDLTTEEVRERQKAMFAQLGEMGLDEEDRKPFALAVSKGRTDSTTVLTRDEWSTLLDTLAKCKEGEYRYAGPHTAGEKRGWARVVKVK